MPQESESPIECIDIGANLTNKRFRNDLPQVLADAKSAGVTSIVLTGTNEQNSVAVAKLCEEHPGYLFATAGVHPHDASEFDSLRSLETLRSIVQEDCVVAVGECGLDYNRDFSPRDKQRSCFQSQLELAAECQLPLFLHERDAFEDFYDIVKTMRNRIAGGVVHCFTGSAHEAKAYLDLDLHLGITGWICDERRGNHLREIVKDIPIERLMIETDCPYLAPRDYRPKINRNEPKYLPHILSAVAQCRSEPVESLAAGLIKTTTEFFQLPCH